MRLIHFTLVQQQLIFSGQSPSLFNNHDIAFLKQSVAQSTAQERRESTSQWMNKSLQHVRSFIKSSGGGLMTFTEVFLFCPCCSVTLSSVMPFIKAPSFSRCSVFPCSWGEASARDRWWTCSGSSSVLFQAGAEGFFVCSVDCALHSYGGTWCWYIIASF